MFPRYFIFSQVAVGCHAILPLKPPIGKGIVFIRPNKYKPLTLARVAADYLTLARVAADYITLARVAALGGYSSDMVSSLVPMWKDTLVSMSSKVRKSRNASIPSSGKSGNAFRNQETKVEFINFSPSIANIY